jgi:hypothetical protein
MNPKDIDIKIVSFYNDNIPPPIVKAQRAVFDKFGIPIEQILTRRSHPDAIDHYIENNQFDALVLFDVDCIPLARSAVSEALEVVTETDCIYGAIQNANHIEGSDDYTSPAFMCFSMRTFKLIGSPSFKPTESGDVGAELTYRARERNIDVKLLRVAEVNVPLWRLSDGTMFGHGTNYDNKVFHAFESSKSHRSTVLFMKKCMEILNS